MAPERSGRDKGDETGDRERERERGRGRERKKGGNGGRERIEKKREMMMMKREFAPGMSEYDWAGHALHTEDPVAERNGQALRLGKDNLKVPETIGQIGLGARKIGSGGQTGPLDRFLADQGAWGGRRSSKFRKE